jgi:DNA-binding NarL/FixJ family response regulator
VARILIADGNETIRRLLKALIENHPGWDVCGEAVGGHDAVAKARELKPDLVILDLAMPDLNGLLASREIAESCPSVPILLHTVHNIPVVVEEAKRFPIRQVVGKGEGGDQIISAIETHLNSKPQGVEAMLREIDVAEKPENGSHKDSRKPN